MNTYGNLALKEIPEFEPEFQKRNRSSERSGECSNIDDAVRLAKDCLQVVSAKFLAPEIGVSARMIRGWASGERDIPPSRSIEIIVRSKGYFVDLSKLETEIDRMILRQFGKAAV